MSIPLDMKPKMPIFFAVLGISFVLLAGCISSQNPLVPSESTAATTGPTLAVTPEPTVSPSITIPVRTFTRDEVGQLFIDIAFGCDNTWINKVTTSPDNHLFYALEGQVTDEDRAFVTSFSETYNRITSTETFSDDPISPKGNPIIVYPGDSLDSLEKAYIGCQERDPETGDLLFLIYKPIETYPSGEQVVTTRIYINAGLQGVKRQHYLERAMLYYLGFPGQTYTYPDSFFYYDSQSSVDLTALDVEAIRTMYNPGIYYGMGVQGARLYLLNT
jgi:hypothetical protein